MPTNRLKENPNIAKQTSQSLFLRENLFDFFMIVDADLISDKSWLTRSKLTCEFSIGSPEFD